MTRKLFLLLTILLNVFGNGIIAQCPDSDSLWKKLNVLQHSTAISNRDQLNELLKWDTRMKNCIFGNDSISGILFQRIGVLYYRLGDFGKAIQYTNTSIGDLRKSGIENNKYIVKGYYNLQIYYDSLKLWSDKYAAIDSCINHEMESGESHYYTSILLAQKAKYLYFRGDYASCLKAASLGEKLVPVNYHSADSLEFTIFFITYQINALYSLNNFEQAEELLISRKKSFVSRNNYYYLSIIYGLLGFVNKGKSNYGQAIIYFNEAFKYGLGARRNNICAITLYQIGNVYAENLHKLSIAFKHYQKALAYANGADSLRINGSIANLFVREHKYDSAYLFFQRAFDAISPGINEKDLLLQVDKYVTPNISEYLINLVLDKGDMYLQQYSFGKKKTELSLAIEVFRKADLLLDKIKSGQSDINSRLFWRSYSKRLYEHAIEVSFLQNNTADAFYFFEKSRAVLLNDQLNEQRLLSQNEILEQAQMKKSLLQLSHKMSSLHPSSVQYKELQTEIFRKDQALNLLEENIRNNNPLYYQSFFDSSFITLNNVQQNLLKDYAALVEIFNGDSAVYILLLTNKEERIFKIDKLDFDSSSDNFISYISSYEKLNRNMDDFIKSSSHLYKILFQNNILPEGRIVISPDGRYFPFEALVVGKKKEGGPEYLLTDHAVSYTYSARYLLNQFISAKPIKYENFLGVAPIKYPASFHLADLEKSDPSLIQIGSFLGGGHNLVGKQATKNNFLQQFSGYKMVQLYTHASDSSDRKEPIIYFADSALYLSELIPEGKPGTQLIVLSACETGNGKLYQGEGVFSFNRGFAALGIPSSITNLWSVDNESTYRLTELFYKYLSQGLPLDIALQKAKKEFIQNGSMEKSMPYYWAAAVLAGKTDAIVLEKPFSWKYILIAFILTSISYTIWLLRKNKES